MFPNLFFIFYVRWSFLALDRYYTSVFIPVSRNFSSFQIWSVLRECNKIFKNEKESSRGRELIFWGTFTTPFLLGRHYHSHIGDEKIEGHRGCNLSSVTQWLNWDSNPSCLMPQPVVLTAMSCYQYKLDYSNFQIVL